MHQQSMIENGRKGGNYCKVRKRGGSSSSSSTLKSYRLKRAVLVGKNATTTTSVSQNDANSCNYSQVNSCEKGKDFFVSARKLGATMWQSNGLKSNSKPLQLSDPPHCHVSKKIDTSKVVGTHKGKTSTGSHKIQQSDYSFESDCFMETRNRLKDVHHGLTTSKQLLEVLSRVWSLEEQQSTCVSLFSALKTALDRACIQVKKQIKSQKCSQGEIDFVLEQFEKEKANWKIREQYRIHSAITSISRELETEKKLRRQTERLNKKLGRELADTKASLLKAAKEVENEKRANEILEQVCDGLAMAMGKEDRANVEGINRESAKIVHEEVGIERGMLQRANVSHEENIQMKLSEAKYQYEEKNAVFEAEYDSDDSELQSIELNMNVDNSKCYAWSTALYNDSKKLTVSDKAKERKLNSGQDSRLHCISPDAESDGSLYSYNGGFFESDTKAWKKGCEDETGRYDKIRTLEEHIVSASRTSSQDFASPGKNFTFI